MARRKATTATAIYAQRWIGNADFLFALGGKLGLGPLTSLDGIFLRPSTLPFCPLLDVWTTSTPGFFKLSSKLGIACFSAAEDVSSSSWEIESLTAVALATFWTFFCKEH